MQRATKNGPLKAGRLLFFRSSLKAEALHFVRQSPITWHRSRRQSFAMDLSSVPLLYAIISKSQHFADISFASYCQLRPVIASYGQLQPVMASCERFRTKAEPIHKRRQGHSPAFTIYAIIFIFHNKKNAATKKMAVAIQIACLADLFVPIVLHSTATKKLIPPSVMKL